MCNMEEIKKIAEKYNLYIVEDAAEAHGAEYKGIKSGKFSDIASFSFFANKKYYNRRRRYCCYRY